MSNSPGKGFVAELALYFVALCFLAALSDHYTGTAIVHSIAYNVIDGMRGSIEILFYQGILPILSALIEAAVRLFTHFVPVLGPILIFAFIYFVLIKRMTFGGGGKKGGGGGGHH